MDDVAPLTRFVQRAFVVRLCLSIADLLQVHSRIALRSCGKTRRRGYLSTFAPNSLGMAGVNWGCRSLGPTLRGEISMFRGSEETLIARLVFARGFQLDLSGLNRLCSALGWGRQSRTGNPRGSRATQLQTFGPSTRKLLTNMTRTWSPSMPET